MIDKRRLVQATLTAFAGVTCLSLGYFLSMLEASPVPSPVERGLFVIGAAGMGVFYISGTNRRLWELRGSLNELSKRRLRVLRGAGIFVSAWILAAVAVPLGTAMVKESIGALAHDIAVYISGLVAAIGICAGLFIRLREIELTCRSGETVEGPRNPS